MRKNLTGKIKFPIDTPTACRWKWAWSSLYLNNGQTSSCHRASFSKIDVDNFDTFHNTPEKISARKIMLDGQWPAGGCEYCQRIEAASGVSDRIHQNTRPHYPIELDSDATAVVVSPVELEVFINNTCNLSCVYCNGAYSSSIAREDKKHDVQLSSYIDRSYAVADNDPALLQKFVQWFEENGHDLKRLNILGGEPLYQKEFYKLLEVIEKHPNKNLELAVTTNLMVPDRYIEQFYTTATRMLHNRCVKTIDLQCSVEGLGPAQEYSRFGFYSNQWCAKFEKFFYDSNFRMMFLSTVNILVVEDMLALAQQWLQWKKHKNIHWSIHDVLPESNCLNLSHHNNEVYNDRLQAVLDCIDDEQTYNLLNSIVKKANASAIDVEKQKQLHAFLQEVDRRRATNWQETFPWLTKYLESV